MTGFADMIGSKLGGIDSISTGGISHVGGNSPDSIAFAQNMCTKLGSCQAMIGQDVSVSSSRGR